MKSEYFVIRGSAFFIIFCILLVHQALFRLHY